MLRANLKQLFRQAIKVVAGGPADKTRGANLIDALDEITNSSVLKEDLPQLLVTNKLRGTPKIVGTLAARLALESAGVLTVATSCYVQNTAGISEQLAGVVAPPAVYLVARNDTLPTGEGFLAFADGGDTSTVVRCEWVLSTDPAARVATFEAFSQNARHLPGNALGYPGPDTVGGPFQVKHLVDGSWQLYEALQDVTLQLVDGDELLPEPGTPAGAAYWQAISPPALGTAAPVYPSLLPPVTATAAGTWNISLPTGCGFALVTFIRAGVHQQLRPGDYSLNVTASPPVLRIPAAQVGDQALVTAFFGTAEALAGAVATGLQSQINGLDARVDVLEAGGTGATTLLKPWAARTYKQGEPAMAGGGLFVAKADFTSTTTPIAYTIGTASLYNWSAQWDVLNFPSARINLDDPAAGTIQTIVYWNGLCNAYWKIRGGVNRTLTLTADFPENVTRRLHVETDNNNGNDLTLTLPSGWTYRVNNGRSLSPSPDKNGHSVYTFTREGTVLFLTIGTIYQP